MSKTFMQSSDMQSSESRSAKLISSGVSPAVINAGLVVSASLLVALCARITLPLPFTPVPLTLQNFGVLLVGVALGPRRAFAAMMLYLAEGAAGMPVFQPNGL